MNYSIKQNKHLKVLRSEFVNYNFDKRTGLMATWGKTQNEDPLYSPVGPFILDIEVTTICKRGCKFCYKSNTANGINMSLDNFKTILDKMPPALVQLAIGADSSATSNPDLFAMMEYARSKEIIPNITVADISDETADRLSQLCGAVAVSRYADKNDCYNSVQKLVSRGMKQVNIHLMISKETKDQAIETIKDYHSDPRLNGMNAIVFLSLKKKGRGEKFTPLTQEDFNEIVELSFANNVSIGFDSCSQKKFIRSIKNHPDKDRLEMLTTSCESTCESSYINTEGKFYACSFCEGGSSFPEGLDVLNCEDFLKDIWFNEKTVEWRNNLLESNKNPNNAGCPVFEV
jgi:MoaA/NifB/PqqE/SkfB family radical SAM enzyme